MKLLISLLALISTSTPSSFAETTRSFTAEEIMRAPNRECAIEIPDDQDNNAEFLTDLTTRGFNPISVSAAKETGYVTNFVYKNLIAQNRFPEDGSVSIITDRANDVLWVKSPIKVKDAPSCEEIKNRLQNMKSDCQMNMPPEIEVNPSFLYAAVENHYYPQLIKNAQAALNFKLMNISPSSSISGKIIDGASLLLAVNSYQQASDSLGQMGAFTKLVRKLFERLGTCEEINATTPLTIAGKKTIQNLPYNFSCNADPVGVCKFLGFGSYVSQVTEMSAGSVINLVFDNSGYISGSDTGCKIQEVTCADKIVHHRIKESVIAINHPTTQEKSSFGGRTDSELTGLCKFLRHDQYVKGSVRYADYLSGSVKIVNPSTLELTSISGVNYVHSLMCIDEVNITEE